MQAMKLPLHRRSGLWVRLLKLLVKTQIGKHIAFMAGLKGFDRVGQRVLKFVRVYQKGEKVKRGEVVLSHHDEPNIPAGEMRVYLPQRFQFSYNSRVNKGAALQASLMSGSSLGSITSPLPPIYVALSVSSITPASGDTTLNGETSVTGLGRALGTVQNYVAPTAVDAAASYDVYKSFTLTGSATTVVSSGLFDASSTGNLFAEANFSSSAAMATNDILQVTWTINI